MAQLKNTKIDSNLEVTKHVEVGDGTKCIMEATGTGDEVKGAIGFPNYHYTDADGQNIFGKNLWVDKISPYTILDTVQNIPTIQIQPDYTDNKDDTTGLTIKPFNGTVNVGTSNAPFNTIYCNKLNGNGFNIGFDAGDEFADPPKPKSVFITSDLEIAGTREDGTKIMVPTYPLYLEFKNVFIDAIGNVHAESYNARSDKRLKENLIPFTSEKSILDLPTYKFDFINGRKNQIGCMAQDLQEICPEIVDEGNDGYLSIQESKIVYLLLEEVKKLRKEIDELKRR